MKTLIMPGRLLPVRWSCALPAGDAEGLPREVAGLARYLHGQVATPAKVAAVLQQLLKPPGYPPRPWRGGGVDCEVSASECGAVALRIGDDAWTLLTFELIDPAGIRVCRLCGCTEDLPCFGGCSWSSPRLCSACEVYFRLYGHGDCCD